jgi:hypothetical protein
MPAPDLATLRRQLLQGGVAPYYVERAILELREHYADIENEAMAHGLSAPEAAAYARTCLGDDTAIASAACARPELLLWTRRWPRTARSLHALALCVVLPAVPVVYCAHRGGSIMRWGASASLAAAMTAGLLFAMQQLLV